MLETLLTYQQELEKSLHENPPSFDWHKEMDFFRSNLLHLQFERLIHLIVTMTVGLATLISCFVSMINQIVPLFLLDGILMILFIAYIVHYRKLENTTQSWYELQNELKRKQ
jgi:hypothetical protein